MLKTLKEDIKTVFAKDPAARSWLEVVLCYPGLQARWAHRLAHFLWRHDLYLLARLLSHLSRFFTGIEIHPGAKIGRRFFIDHGMGVVIGETAEIGDDVLMYQGVVLGGTTLEKKKRHPTIESNVVVGSAAILLGPITIGSGARVGANSVVIKSVPPGATVVGVPGRVVGDKKDSPEELNHGRLPDPVAEAIKLVLRRQNRLEKQLEMLKTSAGITSLKDELEEQKATVEIMFDQGDGI